MDEADDRVPVLALARGFRKRTLVTARLMAKVGLDMAKKNLGARQIVDRVDEDEAVAAAMELMSQLDGLKGFAMKLGQMISYLDASLPPKAQRILARLQSAGSAMDPDTIAAVITTELGAPPSEIFEHFEREPFAAASIGQVHRARRAGRELAVKVQYPGIEELLSKDLSTMSRMSRLALAVTPMNGKELARELSERMIAECDYIAEADNQAWFRTIFADTDGVSVPGVVRELCTRRVLVTEMDPGMGFYDFCERAPQEAKNRAARAIYASCFQSIFRYGAYNADPHPGNFLFTPEGAVTLLDFGCVKRFSPTMIGDWKRLARAILGDDRERFREAFTAAGFVGRRRKFDFDHQFEAMRFLYAPMRASEPFKFTADWIAGVHDHLMFQNQNKHRLDLPADWLFVNRLQFGMFSVLAHLGAEARWGELFRSALESDFTPP